MGAVASLRKASRAGSAASLRAEVERFLASCRDPVLIEPGEAPFVLGGGAGWACTERGSHLLLEAWDETRTLARRVTAVTANRRGQLVLAVERFGGREGRITLADRADPGAAPALLRGERSELLELLRRWLARQYPGWRLREITAGIDLEHSLSGACPRALLTLGQRRCAAVAADSEHAAQALTQALLWADHLKKRDGKEVHGLALFVPKGCECAAALRLRWLNVRAALFVFDEDGVECAADPSNCGNLLRELSPWVEPPEAEAGEAARWVHQLRLEEGVEAVAAAPGEWSLRVHGLEFARYRDGGLFYGVFQRRRARSLEPVRELARELARVRCAGSSEPRHEWRLAMPEAWLESVLRQRLELIDPLLLPQPVYSQVGAVEGTGRGILDLLAIGRDGRLTVIEIKATADTELPLQALDYWARIAHHAARGDLSRCGYFRGCFVDPRPPRLVLAAPALEFHPTTEILLGFFHPDVEVERVGLGVEWQLRPRVVLRVRGSARPEWDGSC
jgi:hypothetical protein